MINVPEKLPLFTVIVEGFVCRVTLAVASLIVTVSPLHGAGMFAPVTVIVSPTCAYDCESDIPGPHSAGGCISTLTFAIFSIDGSAQAPSMLIWYISGDAHSATVMVRTAEAVSPLAGVTLPVDKLVVTPGAEPAVSDTAALKPLMDVI